MVVAPCVADAAAAAVADVAVGVGDVDHADVGVVAYDVVAAVVADAHASVGVTLASAVVFVNGGIDPWHALGFFEKPPNAKTQTVFIPGIDIFYAYCNLINNPTN